MARNREWEAMMKRPLRRKIGKMARVSGAITAAMALVVLASEQNKEKVLLPDYVLKAQTVVVLILPEKVRRRSFRETTVVFSSNETKFTRVDYFVDGGSGVGSASGGSSVSVSTAIFQSPPGGFRHTNR